MRSLINAEPYKKKRTRHKTLNEQSVWSELAPNRSNLTSRYSGYYLANK